MKGHLCIDARLINSSGIGTFLRIVLKGLLESNSFKITLLLLEKDVHNALFETAPASLKKVVIKSPVYSLSEQWELATTIPACDLFWSPHFNIPLLALRAKKRVVTINDCYHLAFKNRLSLLGKLYAHLFYNGALFLSDCVTTCSQFSYTQIDQWCSITPKRCHVIPIGIDRRLFTRQSEEDQARVAAKYLLPTPFILAVGNVKPHKNLLNLLKAFTLLKNSDHGTLKLVIVGKKEGFITGDQPLIQAHQLHPYREEILFLENVDTRDLPAIYSRAALLAFPSFMKDLDCLLLRLWHVAVQ